jgi:hypothetical protein
MVTWSYLLATGQIRFGGACDPEIDPLSEGKLPLRANPDPSIHRINRPGLPGYSTVPSDGVPECGLDKDDIAYVRAAIVRRSKDAQGSRHLGRTTGQQDSDSGPD